MPFFPKALDFIVGSLERLVTMCFLTLAVLLVLLVGLRYVFNTTIIGGDEIAGILFVYTTAFGAAVGVARNRHIRISVVVDLLPATGRWALEAVNAALVMVLHGVLLMLSTDWSAQVGGFETPVLQLPQGIGQIAIPVACALVLVFAGGRLLSILLGRNPDAG